MFQEWTYGTGIGMYYIWDEGENRKKQAICQGECGTTGTVFNVFF